MTMSERPLIIFDNSSRYRNSPNRANFDKQNLLLKGMMVHSGDLKKAAQYAGIRKMADVYRTLDRLTLRKGYYEALDNHDISLDYIVKGIKDVAENGELASVRLKALQVLLKTLGLESYGKEEEGGKGWEELINKAVGAKEDTKELPEVTATGYNVNIPRVPEEELEKRNKENKLGKELYEQ
ncbi:hypothetical protein M0R04_06665 [Candidatus Dojkabacteria bacterium]|jgi:hypothetical protein|nr:hypothetical protein [Candidatus Dojkabacteria bacterium]